MSCAGPQPQNRTCPIVFEEPATRAAKKFILVWWRCVVVVFCGFLYWCCTPIHTYLILLYVSPSARQLIILNGVLILHLHARVVSVRPFRVAGQMSGKRWVLGCAWKYLFYAIVESGLQPPAWNSELDSTAPARHMISSWHHDIHEGIEF